MSVYDFDGLLADGPKDDDELPLFDEGDENQEDENPPETEGIKVEPKKRTVRNPRPRLTAETLQGPRGIHTIEEYFKDFKFKGKGYEAEDLNEIMKRMQHWAHRLYPNFKFDDALNTIERLGHKKSVQAHMARYRLNMLEPMITESQLAAEAERLDDDEVVDANEPLDEFDALLDQQIAMSRLDPRTPAAKSRPEPKTPATSSSSYTFNMLHQAQSTPYPITNIETPKLPAKRKFSAEELARIEENKRLARERLAARKAQLQQQQPIPEEEEEVEENM